MVKEVRALMKEMLEAVAIHPTLGTICFSQSLWCNAIVLVRKKNRGLHFCIDFHKSNARTKGDSYPLPHMQEAIESLVGGVKIFLPGPESRVLADCHG